MHINLCNGQHVNKGSAFVLQDFRTHIQNQWPNGMLLSTPRRCRVLRNLFCSNSLDVGNHCCVTPTDSIRLPYLRLRRFIKRLLLSFHRQLVQEYFEPRLLVRRTGFIPYVPICRWFVNWTLIKVASLQNNYNSYSFYIRRTNRKEWMHIMN